MLYASSGDGLIVMALDARSGSTVWSDAASPSGNAPGQPPELAIVDGKVVYLRAVEGNIAELVERDPQSGREAWHSEPGHFSSWPSVCPARPTAVCLTGTLSSQPEGGGLLTFDGHGGSLIATAEIGGPGGREVGTGLFDPGVRNPEEVVSASGSTIIWNEPLQKIFTLPGASTDWGWNFDRVPRVGLFVGSPGWAPVSHTRARLVRDLSRSMTAGFRITDGSVVWRSPGSYDCTILPCPGADNAGFSSPAAVGASIRVGVRLRASGRVSASPAGEGAVTVSPNTTVALEGFDPANGTTRWAFQLGHGTRIISLAEQPPQLDGETVVLRDATGRFIALNLATGSRRVISPSDSAWCRKLIRYHEAVPYRPGNGQSITSYIGQFALFACAADQRRLAAPKRAPAFVGELGAQADGLVAWSDTGAVAAAPTSG